MISVTQIARAKTAGLINVEALAAACTKHRLPFYLGCVILAKESGGRNIFGHDRGGVFSGPSNVNIEVTEDRYREFRRMINSGKTSNGVGPMQITYKGHFPIMDRLGLKPWVPADNIDYGIGLIAADWHAQRKAGKSIDAALKYAATVYNLGSYRATWPYGIDAVARAVAWKARVGTEDMAAAAPVKPTVPDAVPPPVATPPVVTPPVVVVKPVRGSSKEWVRVDALGRVVKTGGYWVTTRGLAMHLEAGRLFRAAGGGEPPLITQGGRNAGGVAASAGTHDREAFDWATKTFTPKRVRLWELCTWCVGFASWTRTFIAGLWPAHTHGVPKGGDLSRGAKDQVEGHFWKSLDGLRGKGRYPRIGKSGLARQTWETYLAQLGVSLAGLQRAFADRKVTDDVKDVQWALSRELGTDLVIDGDPGPETKTALAKVGPLTAATLEAIGLTVNP